MFEVRFSSPLQDFTFRNKIQKILTGAQGAVIPNEAINYKDVPQKLSVVVQPLRIGITSESENKEKNLRAISTLANSLNDELRFGYVGRLGFRQIHYLEVESDSYDTLTELFKSKFFSSASGLINAANDIALPLTINQYPYPVNFNLGPMQGSELSEKGVLEFDDLKLPELYLMADLDAFTSGPTMSHKFVKTFLSDSCSIFDKIHSSISKEWSSK